MARSRSLAICFLITRMFMFLLICLNSTKAAMGYDLLLGKVHYLESFSSFFLKVKILKRVYGLLLITFIVL